MLLLVIVAALFSGCCANILQPYNETALNMFHGNDFNGDGKFERSELDFTFYVYDTEPLDGIISRLEYTSYINKTTPELYRLSHELYDIYDIDNDNRLEKHDYDAFFQLMDSDDDGWVTEHEFVHYWTILLESLGHLIDVGGTR
ncbi:hypothetical protein SNE40_000581 [Patella caerulea]|uniref:EF-hand domain-containing protein n=1 Tax=Patella caerulea TaxID=87958 RepID=A0AAN8K5F7_PATCE